MGLARLRHHQHLGQAARLARIGEQAQALGEKAALAAAMLLVAQGSEKLDRGIGKAGDGAAHVLGSVLAETVQHQARQFCQSGFGAFAGLPWSSRAPTGP